MTKDLAHMDLAHMDDVWPALLRANPPGSLCAHASWLPHKQMHMSTSTNIQPGTHQDDKVAMPCGWNTKT